MSGGLTDIVAGCMSVLERRIISSLVESYRSYRSDRAPPFFSGNGLGCLCSQRGAGDRRGRIIVYPCIIEPVSSTDGGLKHQPASVYSGVSANIYGLVLLFKHGYIFELAPDSSPPPPVDVGLMTAKSSSFVDSLKEILSPSSLLPFLPQKATCGNHLSIRDEELKKRS